MLSKTATLQLAPGVTWTESEGEVLVFDEPRDRVFGIDGPAAAAFVLLERGAAFGDAVNELLAIYEVEREALERDLGAVLDCMRAERVIAIRDACVSTTKENRT